MAIFLDKIKNLDPRDKISILIGMFAFLILINFTDFSGFKASVISPTEEEIKNTIKLEIPEKESETETELKKESEEVLEPKEATEDKNINLKTDLENNLENEILEDEIAVLKEETEEPKLTEVVETEENNTPILIDNIETKEEILPVLENAEQEVIVDTPSKNTEEEIVGQDKNLETLIGLENEDKKNEIEVISDTTNNSLDEIHENKSELEDINTEGVNSEYISNEEVSTENISNESLNLDEKNTLDQKINEATQEIEEIKTKEEIQKQAEILAEKIISEKALVTKEEGLPEDDFTVSGEETESYNELIRQKKEDEIVAKYEKIIKEQEQEKKDLNDRLEMLENKINNKAPEKTVEEIEKEKEELSLREIAKREAKEKLKKLEEKKAEELKNKEIEDKKIKDSLEILNKDSDGDGLSNHVEKIIETNEKLIDTDSNGYSDKTEIEKFLSPNSDGLLFSDIPERDSRKKTIISGVKKGLVFARTGDKFLPDEKIYRNEAIKIIVSAMYPSEIYREADFFEGVELYEDTSSTDDYARYLAIAIKHGILDGIIADTFEPYSTFSKAEFIKILINATGKGESNKKIKWIDTEYDNWFTGYLSKAKELRIIKTETYNRIFPLKEISRYEAVSYSIKASK